MDKKKEVLSRRKQRVRTNIGGRGIRLSVSRSNRYLFAQIIDSKTGATLVGMTDKKLLDGVETKGKTKTEKASLFGEKFGKVVLDKKIKNIVFDRGTCRYHGRIKAFAEGLRKAGLIF